MYNLRRVWLVLLALAALSLVLLVACEEEKETPTPEGTPTATAAETPTPGAVGPGITDTEILLGADAPIAGASGAVYATIPQATEAYFKYVNDTEGGVCGRKIVYKIEDNQDDPARAIEVVRKLVEQDEVFAMVGSLGDSPHVGTWEYLNDMGVPDILVSAGSHLFGSDPEAHPWTVQMIPSYRTEGFFMGQYISENLPGAKVGILRPNLIMGTDQLEGLEEGLDPDKNEIVSDQIYEITAVTVASQVTNIKNDGAEVVVTLATPGFTAQAINQANRLDWHPQWMIGYNNSDDMMFQFVSPDLLAGAITSQSMRLASWTDDPAVAEHYRIMEEYGGPEPTNFTVYAQTLGEVAVEALKGACDNLTREGLMASLESIQGFKSDLFIEGIDISFSDTDHTGLQGGRFLRAMVEDGQGKWEYFGPLNVYSQEQLLED